MKKLLILGLLLASTLASMAQSRSVERFRQENKPDTKLFFYKSTLKMISRIDLSMLGNGDVPEIKDMPPIGDLIKGIEKVKFFLFEGSSRDAVDGKAFKALEREVLDEGYESMMSARVEQSTMNVLMTESRGKPNGFVVLIEMEDGFSIIDIEGVPDVNNILKLSQFLNSTGSNMSLEDAFR